MKKVVKLNEFGSSLAATKNRLLGERRLAGAMDPEVLERPRRRKFSAEYKVRILREAERDKDSGQCGSERPGAAIGDGILGRSAGSSESIGVALVSSKIDGECHATDSRPPELPQASSVVMKSNVEGKSSSRRVMN
jgi:hypothetical protein